jgi:hypothetical protein
MTRNGPAWARVTYLFCRCVSHGVETCEFRPRGGKGLLPPRQSMVKAAPRRDSECSARVDGQCIRDRSEVRRTASRHNKGHVSLGTLMVGIYLPVLLRSNRAQNDGAGCDRSPWIASSGTDSDPGMKAGDHRQDLQDISKPTDRP